ncbi:hypothetical protein LMH87_005629 [Akanthomyces muscarius]|uniref:Uncharacterized protein n=1 Tax=Akanthomyces muscarius TaxID=2231603 RepID=A0A9W8USA9_AKAMU|nr:hypothetical protein LMH87_005629 [Akanthomyces muscarius]KAJ4163929.1 hypothetical protein LMH87_005629 [Akanthomyces muscarius]
MPSPSPPRQPRGGRPLPKPRRGGTLRTLARRGDPDSDGEAGGWRVSCRDEASDATHSDKSHLSELLPSNTALYSIVSTSRTLGRLPRCWYGYSAHSTAGVDRHVMMVRRATASS